MRKVIFVLVAVLAFNAAKATTNDSITITCITKWKSLANFNLSIREYLSIKEYPKNFEKSKVISITTKLNDSTWILKVPLLKKDKNFQAYSLSFIGPTYKLFLSKGMHKAKIYIDTSDNKRLPYKFLASENNELGFCIEFENYARYEIDYLTLRKMTDTVAIAEKLASVSDKINELKEKYATQISKNEVFASFVNTETLYFFKGLIPDAYKNTFSGRRLLDSLSNECNNLVHDPSIVYSRSATLLGVDFIQDKIEKDLNGYSDTNLVKVADKAIATLPVGIYNDYIIKSFLRRCIYQKNATPQNINDMYVYAKRNIKDKELLKSVNDDYKLYINESRLLPEEVLVRTKFITPKGETLSLKEILNRLQKEGKEKVLIDFWASWCGPCKLEITETTSLIDSLKRNQKAFDYLYLSIDVPQKYKAAKQFASQKNIQDGLYFLVNSDQSPLHKYFSINAIPYHLLLDIKSRKFVADTVGPILKEEFTKLIEDEFNKL